MQLKNGCLEVLEFVALFVLKNGNLPREKLLRVFRRCYNCFVKNRLVSKREGQIQSKFDKWKFYNVAPQP